MENKIIVIYVGVAGIRSEDIEDYIQKITSKIVPESVQAEFIIIPVQSYDTRLECINPKYITEDKLIKEHTEKLKLLNEELQHQIEEYKNGKK
ncbi:MAG: hypothetical protein ACOC33_03465 [bacterium]